MTPARVVALAQLCSGRLLRHRPDRALSLLSYPVHGAGPRSVVRVLGTRQLVQGAAELSGRRSVLLAGVAADVLHAGTAIAYAQYSSVGRTAGRRSAALALAFAGAQLVAALRTPVSTARPQRRVPAPQPSRPASVPRVGGPLSPAWPGQTGDEQQVFVEYPREQLVHLTGGVMDDATVTLEPGETSYSITDNERRRVHYLPTGEQNENGTPVLRLADDEPRPS